MTTRRRARVGPWLMGLGALHLAATPVFFGDALRSIVDGGVLFSVDADPDLVALRGSGFWYATAGLGVVALGAVTDHVEQQTGSTPPVLAPILLATGVWGVALDPPSGFWAFFPLAALARRGARSAEPGHHARTSCLEVQQLR